MKKSSCIALLMMLLLMSMPAASTATVFYNSGTNHYYELVDATPTPEYWKDAGYNDGAIHWRMWSLAEQRAMANGGHLVTINDAAENQWLVNTFVNLVTTGHINDQGIWVQDNSGVFIGLYQADTTNEPAGGWTWVSGSTGSYRNWLTEEPNNSGGSENWGAMYLALGWGRNGYWLDVPEPWGKFDYGQWQYGIAEYETNPYAVPIPPAAWLLGSGLLAMVVIRRRFRR